MQFDILQNKRIIGAPYCFCLLNRIFKLTLWSLAGTRIWNLGPDFFPLLLSLKTNDATFNSFTTMHFSLDIWCTTRLVFWSTENLFSQTYTSKTSCFYNQKSASGMAASSVQNFPLKSTTWLRDKSCASCSLSKEFLEEFSYLPKWGGGWGWVSQNPQPPLQKLRSPQTLTLSLFLPKLCQTQKGRSLEIKGFLVSCGTPVPSCNASTCCGQSRSFTRRGATNAYVCVIF